MNNIKSNRTLGIRQFWIYNFKCNNGRPNYIVAPNTYIYNLEVTNYFYNRNESKFKQIVFYFSFIEKYSYKIEFINILPLPMHDR
jgi:hypothetical protein